MQTALDAFDLSMQRVKALHALHATLFSQVTAVIDLTDILRAEIVMAVSAFDFFIHELTRLGMLEVLAGARVKTDAFNRWQIPLGLAADVYTSSTSQQVLGGEIRERHGYLSFQQPDKVADAIRLFSNVKLWEAVARELGEDPKDTKTTFKLIIDRRNQIAHEADINPSYPGALWPIDRLLVETIVSRIETVANAIYRVAV